MSQDCTTLYGTAQNGGINGAGVLFSINYLEAELNPNGNPSGYNLVTAFSESLNGSLSRSALTLGGNDNYLFGSLSSGGQFNNGLLIVYDLARLTLISYPFQGGSLGSDPLGKVIVQSPIFGMQPRGIQANATTNVDLSTITLYGVTRSGGSNSWGTVYRVQANGSNFMVLHHFNFSTTDGATPQGGMVLYSNMLYGTTSSGGLSYGGTVFKLNTNGTGFQIIGNFAYATTGSSPQGDLIRSGHTLYGTTYIGGAGGGGTVYSIGTDGSNFQPLYSFSSPTADGNGNYTNRDGGWSVAGLTLDDNILYGTTPYGGSNGVGTAYEIILPSRPRLKIAPTNGTYNISWPTYASGYVLQQSSSLTNTNWTAANYGITTNGLMANVAISPPKGNLFFRLVNTNGRLPGADRPQPTDAPSTA